MKLAVCSHHIGTPSETFIRRHMLELVPEDTVVIAESLTPTGEPHWNVTVPSLLLQGVSRAKSFTSRLLGKVGMTQFSPRDKAIVNFLKLHAPDVMMVEYLDYAVQYIPLAQHLGIPIFAHAHGYDISLRLQQA